jgi:hypothetical protein
MTRRPRTDADVEAYIEDLEKIIREVESLQIAASRAMFRRRGQQS